MKEHLTELQRKLFDFARSADQINSELRELSMPVGDTTDADRSLIAANHDFQPYLSQIARKAEYLASCLGVVGMTDAKKAELSQ